MPIEARLLMKVPAIPVTVTVPLVAESKAVPLFASANSVAGVAEILLSRSGRPVAMEKPAPGPTVGMAGAIVDTLKDPTFITVRWRPNRNNSERPPNTTS